FSYFHAVIIENTNINRSNRMKINAYRNEFFAELRFLCAAILPCATGRKMVFRKIKRFAFCAGGLLLNLSCNKSSGVNKNKAFVTVSHVAPGFSALDVFYNGTSILGDTGLDYNEISGTPDNPYVEATAGVRLLQIAQGRDDVCALYKFFSGFRTQPRAGQ